MSETFRACFQDTFQYASSRAYALQIHLVLQFDKPLYADRVRRALRLILDREPVLGSRFVLHWWCPFWQKMSPDEKAEALCNLSGFLFPNIGLDLGDDLDQTLRHVKAKIDAYKQSGNIGLPFMPVTWMSGLLMPYALICRSAAWVFDKIAATGNIVPILTNLGRIRHQTLDFDDLTPVYAETLPPPVIPPFFGMGLSGYQDTLALSCGFFPAAVARTDVERLLDTVDRILPT